MLKPRIDMIGILTSRFEEMLAFYRDVLGFKVTTQMEHFAEFENEGVRLALSTHEVMADATGDVSFKDPVQGHAFELAFRVDRAEDVDSAYKQLLEKGAQGIKAPADMPWGQRTTFFADPDGNVHEVFCDLS